MGDLHRCENFFVQAMNSRMELGDVMQVLDEQLKCVSRSELITEAMKTMYENGCGQFQVLKYQSGQMVLAWCPTCQKVYDESEIEEYNAPIYYCPKAHIMRAK